MDTFYVAEYKNPDTNGWVTILTGGKMKTVLGAAADYIDGHPGVRVRIKQTSPKIIFDTNFVSQSDGDEVKL